MAGLLVSAWKNKFQGFINNYPFAAVKAME